jgi:Mce-associated membrane protein
MLADARGESRAAWLTAGVLGVFVVLLGAGLGVLLVVRGHHSNPGLTTREQAAVDAASREMINLQSFRLAQFESDFARAQDGVTGDLAKAFASKKASLLNGLKNSKQDTSAAVTQAAFERIDGNAAQVLMTMNNYRIDAKGKKTLFTAGRFEVTVNNVGGRWLTSNLTAVGLM